MKVSEVRESAAIEAGLAARTHSGWAPAPYVMYTADKELPEPSTMQEGRYGVVFCFVNGKLYCQYCGTHFKDAATTNRLCKCALELLRPNPIPEPELRS